MAAGPARSDAVRRHNLARLLREVHRHGQLSRADLTARLELNRSTIGTLVAELIGDRILQEQIPDGPARPASSAGRPSHVVGPRPDGPFVVAVDLDVDTIGVATVGIAGTVLNRREFARADTDPRRVVTAIAAAVREIIGSTCGFPVGIGVSVPGSVEPADGLVVVAPNLGWHDVPLRRLLRTALGRRGLGHLPIEVGNDANLAAVAEYVRGHGRGHHDLVFLLGRIGVGAGIIVDGRLLVGASGGAGEVGHLSLAADGPPCHCGSRGCAEVFIGDDALLTAAGRPGAPRDDLDTVFTAAAAGRVRELAALTKVSGQLGRTIAALLNVVNPSLVVAGGTFARVLEVAGEAAHSELARYAFGHTDSAFAVRVATTQAGEGCLLGAAELAFEPLLADPAAFELTSAAAN